MFSVVSKTFKLLPTMTTTEHSLETFCIPHFLCLEWMAHWNAVFDLAWVPGELKLVSDFHFIGIWVNSGKGCFITLWWLVFLKVTAAGDQSAKFWDVKAGELLGTCKGHQCSLKSVAFSKFEKGRFVPISSPLPPLWWGNKPQKTSNLP